MALGGIGKITTCSGLARKAGFGFRGGEKNAAACSGEVRTNGRGFERCKEVCCVFMSGQERWLRLSRSDEGNSRRDVW